MFKKAVLWVDNSETSERVLEAFGSVPEVVEIHQVRPGQCADFVPPCLITEEGVIIKEERILAFAQEAKKAKARAWFECWEELPQNEKEKLMCGFLGSTNVGRGILGGQHAFIPHHMFEA